MRNAGMLVVALGILATFGCSTKNLKEPTYVDISKPVLKRDDISGKDFEDSRLAPISNLQGAYASYRDGAATNKTTLSAIALGGAGVAAIGLATNSHSDLYKSSAAIIATAFGLESWGNFKGQFAIYDDALSYLSCARTHTTTIVENSAFEKLATGAIDNIRTRENEVNAAYSNGVNYAAIKSLGSSPSADLKKNSVYLLPDESASITPTAKQTIGVGIAAEAETQDIIEARKILASHRVRVELDMSKLQNNVTRAVSNSSFDTKKAVAIIVPKLSKESGAGGEAEELLNTTETTTTLEKAHTIIDAYNSYQLCSADPD